MYIYVNCTARNRDGPVFHCIFLNMITLCVYKQNMDKVDKKLSQEEKVLENLKTECNEANIKIQNLHAETESMRALV